MKRNFIICLFSLFAACDSTQTYDLVIQDVGLFDGETDRGVVNIAINADTIAAISKENLLSDSVIIGTGMYVIPGLVNSHVHIWEDQQLKEGYDVGILANMGMHASNRVRDSTIKAAGMKSGYPFYYSSGVAATVPGGHPTQITPNIETVNDSLSVEQFVNNRIANGVDYIKIIKESSVWFEHPEGPPSLPYDSIKKIIDYTHSKGLKVVVHIGSLDEMVQIAKLKPDGFVHMWYSSIDADLTDEKLAIIKESGAFVVPTVLINERAILETQKDGGPLAEWAKENFLPMDELLESVRRVHEAGVTILAGTDNGNFDLNWGDDLVNELIMYHRSGLNNTAVLKTATGNASKVWDIPVGHLEVGSKANMVLLNGNPLEDLQHLKDVNTVWKGGLSE